MRILHTADLHLYASLSASHLPREKVSERKNELFSTFRRLVEEAERQDVCAFLIAGDLFDTEDVPKRALKNVASVIAAHPQIAFYYLSGNHEKDTFLPLCEGLCNLYTFKETFTTYRIGENVTVSGRTVIAPEQWGELSLAEGDYSIVMLHGNTANKTAEYTAGLSDAAKAGVRYLALGHYHSFRKTPLSNGGVAVYPGTPEGRGFDETGEKGYVLIDTEKGTETFVPFAKRRLFDLSLDVTDAENDNEILARAETLLADVRREDLVRLRLCGCYNIRFQPDPKVVKAHFDGGFYVFDVKDESHLHISAEDYRYDRSLKGEFIRTVLADETLDEEMKEAVLIKGLSALTGGVV